MTRQRYYYKGEWRLVSPIARMTGIHRNTLGDRLAKGMTIDKAVAESCRRKPQTLTFNGETHTISEWSAITGIHPSTLRDRVSHYGWTVEKALTTPIDESRRRKPQPGGSSSTSQP